MQVAVVADLVPGGNDAAHHRGVAVGRVARDEEGGAHAVPVEHPQDASTPTRGPWAWWLMIPIRCAVCGDPQSTADSASTSNVKAADADWPPGHSTGPAAVVTSAPRGPAA